MIIKKTYAYLAAGLLLASSSGVSYAAADNRDAVLDMRGNAVVDQSGNCIRTKWFNGEGECGSVRVTENHVISAVDAEDARTVYFDFNKSSLTPTAQARLNTLADSLKSAGDVYSARIVGYADRIGDAEYNERLSKDRAQSVQRYLVSRGYMNSQVADTRWVGETQPATECGNDLNREQLIGCLEADRKVEIELEHKVAGR